MAVDKLTRSMTYAQFVSAITANSGAGSLKKGESITITDFATVHYMVDGECVAILNGETQVINTGVNEPLTVYATSSNTIDKEAKSMLYPEDVIYYDWDETNWINDKSFGNGVAIVAGFKGVIYFRHDTLRDNYTGYDFKNVKYRRWESSINISNWVSADAKYTCHSQSQDDVVSINNFIDILTFNCPDGLPQYNSSIRGVKFDSIKEDNSFRDWNKTLLANNVFHLYPLSQYSGPQVFCLTFGALSKNNTLLGYLETSQFGTNFCNNVLGDYSVHNTVGQWFSYNKTTISKSTFGNYCHFITIPYINNCRFGSNTKLWFGNVNFKNTMVGDGTWDELDGMYVGHDFTGATHVAAEYGCEIIKSTTGILKLKYIDGSDNTEKIVNATA